MLVALSRWCSLPTLVLSALVACLVFSYPTRAAEPSDVTPVRSGAGLDWGLKESWRNYIGDGGTTMSDGATRNADGTFHFPVTGGTYDPTTKATVVHFGGTVQFLAHCEGAGPTDRPCALDMTIYDPWIEINEDRAILHARMASRPRSGGDVAQYPDVPLAALDIEDAEPAVTPTTTTWSDLPAQVTLEASDIFTYTVGTVLDPVTFGYDGPGGKPALEAFAEPATPLYERVAVPGDPTLPRMTVPGPSSGTLLGIHWGSESPGLSVIDRETFETVPGSFLEGSFGGFSSVAADPRTGTVFGTESGPEGKIIAHRWDGSSWSTVPVEGSTIVPSSNSGGGIWDHAQNRYLVSRQVGSQSQLWQVKEVGGIWTASNLGTVRQTNTVPAPLLQSIAVVTNGDPNSSSLVLASWFGQVYRLASTETGFVAEPLPQAPGVTAVRLIAVADGAYAINGESATYIPYVEAPWWPSLGTAMAPVTIPAAAGLSTLDTGLIATDPARDTIYVASYGVAKITKITAGKLVHSFSIPGMAHLTYYSDFLAGTTTAGDVVISSGTEGDEFSLAHRSTTPSFPTQPGDATVDVTEADGTTDATFTSVAAGEPGATVRWQSRMPGASGWVDVPGADTQTLTVTVGPADNGRQYRAVATNSAGEVASDRATLTVRTPPTVAIQAASTTVTSGASARFEVMPGGNPEPTVTWQQLVGGFWRNVDTESGDFDIDGGFLTVLETRDAMDGATFRAKLSNPVGTTYSHPATLNVQTLVDGPVTIRGGTLDWGFAARWRCYVVGTVSNGGIEPTGGIAPIPDTLATGSLCAGGHNVGSEALRFPVTGGSYEPAAKTLSVDLGGTVRFWGHVTAGVPLLDTTFSHLHLEAAGDTGLLYGDAFGATMDDPTPVTHTDVPIVSVDLAGTGPSMNAGRLEWSDAGTALTASGAPIFGAYPEGEPFDPISMSLSTEPTSTPGDDEGGTKGPESSTPIQAPQAGQGAAQAPKGSSSVKARIAAGMGTHRVTSRGLASIATVACPTGAGSPCKVSAPRRVAVVVARKRFVVGILAPKAIAPGHKASLRVRLPGHATSLLSGRSATVKVKITVAGGSRRTTGTITARISRPAGKQTAAG